MDSLKPNSAPTKSKLAKTLQKVIHLKRATRTLSNASSLCLLLPPQNKPKRHLKHKSHSFDKDNNNNNNNEEAMSRNRAAMEAFVAKLFATISTLKANYAELQMAQFPYNSEAIQSADEAVVSELTSLSELKQKFLRKQIDFSPHVTMLLTEIQEQQSSMKMYEINMKKMQSELETKEIYISSLEEELREIVSSNESLEKRLNSSGQFSVLDGIKLSDPNPNSFNIVLQYTVRSIRYFVKEMICAMESAKWDVEAAAKAVESEVMFSKPNHKCFAFESFVCQQMFDGFDSQNFSIPKQSKLCCNDDNQFSKLKGVNPIQFLKTNPNSAFGEFTKAKYLRLVHPKMETSFSGNLGQRKLISSGECPETGFFAAFAEMGKRVWLLHYLAFSFDREVSIFMVGKKCRFSEVYMESVTDDEFAAGEDGIAGGFRVAFTVVPGFKIGKTVFQSQVYLLPVDTC